MRSGVALALGGERLGGAQAAAERDGGRAVLRAEVGVAAAHREAVGLADDRPDDELDVVEVQVGHQARDDGHLLGVLAAEDGPVGPHGEQELGDDGGDAAEVLGPRRALEARRSGRSTVIAVPKPSRVDLVGAGGEDEVDAGAAGQLQVAGLVARVRREVLGRARTASG